MITLRWLSFLATVKFSRKANGLFYCLLSLYFSPLAKRALVLLSFLPPSDFPISLIRLIRCRSLPPPVFAASAWPDHGVGNNIVFLFRAFSCFSPCCLPLFRRLVRVGKREARILRIKLLSPFTDAILLLFWWFMACGFQMCHFVLFSGIEIRLAPS